MAKKKKSPKTSHETKLDQDDAKLKSMTTFYQQWDEDNEQKRTRKNGWDDITRAYYGELPEDWPYITRVTDPRIRTSIIEKDARLLNKKPKGRVIPRNDSKSTNASIQNAILSLQWDNATNGGSMQEKLLISSQDARMYQSKFALVLWKEIKNDKGEITFSGNDIKPLDIRDCGMDANATHIRDAKRFQHREWVYIDDLEKDNTKQGKELWKNLDSIRADMADKNFKPYYESSSDRRDNERQSAVLGIKGLTDRVGEDSVYPMLLLVHEYREGEWLSFSPRFGKIVREIDNPYKHGKIPVSQLRYYPIQDDATGESEVEAVLPLWKAIQATICGYLDEMILKMRPPLKIVEGQARIETIEYGPEAQWLVDSPDAVTEMRSTGEAQRWFTTTYAALVSAFNTAMGDLSQNVSNIDQFSGDKTATEIKQTAKQQNARDQRNQNELSDYIKDFMLMWISNNRQFLLSKKSKKMEIIKLVGEDQYEEFVRLGLANKHVPDEAMNTIGEMIANFGGNISDEEVANIYEQASVPSNPVITNPGVEGIENQDIVSKLDIDQQTGSAALYVEPSDFDGDFDFIVDVKSMEAGSSVEFVQSRQMALNMMKDQTMMGLLVQEGWSPKVKDIMVSILNEGGFNDSQKYFQRLNQQGAGQAAGVPSVKPGQGLPELPAPTSEKGLEQPLARPQQV